MVTITSNAQFDFDSLDLGPLYFSRWEYALTKDANLTSHGVTYSDVYLCEYSVGGTILTARLGGNRLEVDGFNNLIGGRLTGLEFGYVDGGRFVSLLVVQDFSIAASTFFATIMTADATDDRAAVLTRLRGNDSFDLGATDDLAYGSMGNDTMSGGGGRDALYGGRDDDFITGGRGIDTLSGGFGSDRFVFLSEEDSRASDKTSDVITDFQQGIDLIDLSAIDAFAPSETNDTFVWRGTSFTLSSTQGDIRYGQFYDRGTDKTYTLVVIDTDGDGGSEMVIRLLGTYALTEADFVL